MPFLPLGRLFWKFLLFFFLAQMTTVVGTGLAIWAVKPSYENLLPPPPPPEDSAASGEFGEPRIQGKDHKTRRPPPPPHAPKPPIVHLLAGTLVSLIFAALLAAYVSRPIRRLRLALQAAASGQLAPELSAAMGKRRDELADLGKDFDRMAQHLAQLMEGQRHLLHDVSHELRSPLARLNTIIGLMRQQPEKLEEGLSRLEHESTRMDRLLSELLTLSRLESGIARRDDDVVDLSELLGDVITDAAPEIEQAACRTELKSDNNVRVKGDPEMLHRVFDNLLRNALTHAASGGWIGITLSASKNQVEVRVEDRGPGVLSSEIRQLFVPFYRGAKTSANSGHGLGLAISQQIVENHHGHISAENRPEGGLRLTVVLPRLPRAQEGSQST